MSDQSIIEKIRAKTAAPAEDTRRLRDMLDALCDASQRRFNQQADAIDDLRARVSTLEANVERLNWRPPTGNIFPPLCQMDALVVQIWLNGVQTGKAARTTTTWSLGIEFFRDGKKYKRINVKLYSKSRLLETMQSRDCLPDLILLVQQSNDPLVGGLIVQHTKQLGTPYRKDQLALMRDFGAMKDAKVLLCIGHDQAMIAGFTTSTPAAGGSLWVARWEPNGI